MSKPFVPGGAALMIVFFAVLPVRCAVLSDLTAIPNPFSPDGDGTYDETELSYTLDDSLWTVAAVEDSSGGVVRELWSGFQAADSYSYDWDGRDTGGEIAADGWYTFAVTAGSERMTLSLSLDTTSPAITGFTVTPSRFTPDGDGVSDSLRVDFVVQGADQGDLVSVDVQDSEDTTVAALLAGTGLDTVSLYWNGKAEGAVLADTTYHIVVYTLDIAGNAASERSTVDLDTDPPALGSAVVDTNDVVAVDGTTAELSGWAFDRAGVDSVEYSTDGETWALADLTPHGAVDGAAVWSFELVCPACTLNVVDDVVDVSVRAYDGTLTEDGAGHVNTPTSDPAQLDFEVVFDVAAPIKSSSSVTDDDSVYEPGETVTIETIWDQSGYTIEAFFYQVDSEFDPENVAVSDFGNGSYEITYTISSASTLVPVGPERVRIVASDYFNAVADSSVAISVVEPTTTPTGLSVDSNSFDPGEGESVTINPGGSSGAAEIDIYTMAGTLVVSLTTDADTPVAWDGTNADGEIVASGVYFLLIRVDGDETVRKVAVVK